jgi:hypothetical protein
VHKIVGDLDDAMLTSFVTFAISAQIVLIYIHSKLTKRNFVFRDVQIVDLGTLIFLGFWIVKEKNYSKATNMGLNLEKIPTREEIFLEALLVNIASGNFHFDFLLAGFAFFYWIRIILMLKLSSTFGPLIQIFIKMSQDMGTFFGLFFLQIVAFSAVGVLSFGEIHEYNDLPSAVIMIFQTAMGNWDFTIYDVLSEERRVIGIIFHFILICVNLLLLLNLMIALMSDTYADLSEFKKSLYYKNIIRAMNHY